MVVYDSGYVSLQHLVLSRHPSQTGRARVPVDVMNENPLSQPTLSLSPTVAGEEEGRGAEREAGPPNHHDDKVDSDQ